jgi:hypothetical protein
MGEATGSGEVELFRMVNSASSLNRSSKLDPFTMVCRVLELVSDKCITPIYLFSREHRRHIVIGQVLTVVQ